jgi:hypothetical protein
VLRIIKLYVSTVVCNSMRQLSAVDAPVWCSRRAQEHSCDD